MPINWPAKQMQRSALSKKNLGYTYVDLRVQVLEGVLPLESFGDLAPKPDRLTARNAVFH